MAYGPFFMRHIIALKRRGYQPKFFHRLAKANDYELAELTLAPQREFALPDYLRGQGLPASFASAGLTVIMRRRDRRKFTMPIDA
jgi:hypothetical protein